jgi:hypothetical protein
LPMADSINQFCFCFGDFIPRGRGKGVCMLLDISAELGPVNLGTLITYHKVSLLLRCSRRVEGLFIISPAGKL